MVQSDLNYDIGLGDMIFFTSKSMEYVRMSVISALLAWCCCGMREKGPKIVEFGPSSAARGT
jgi:hypothetical protein